MLLTITLCFLLLTQRALLTKSSVKVSILKPKLRVGVGWGGVEDSEREKNVVT